MKYSAIGLMSGTSLDGLDIVGASFVYDDNKWSYEIDAFETVEYSEYWKERLVSSMKISGYELSLLDVELGKYWGGIVEQFIKKNDYEPLLVASHGHTVFHQPNRSLTLQIGSGQALFQILKRPIIYDFRTADVLMGGQGAPLVPKGDQLLFSDYGVCLNLGGIANISFQIDDKRKAFDICACNIVLNLLASQVGLEYDEGGKIAQKGKVNDELLRELNALPFLEIEGPKSLGREWVDYEVIPLFQLDSLSLEDKLATMCEHVAIQVSRYVAKGEKLLCTGGGAFNTFLLSRIAAHTGVTVDVTSSDLIAAKEALIFAFLGVLRWRKEDNVLSSATGAIRDHSAGIILQ